MPRYFKVTNANEQHHGYQYHNGLNILLEPFNNDPTASCVSGGFYFTTIEHITDFYGYGINLREIYLPESDPEFKMIKDPDGNKWRANRIILGEKYSLFDLTTYALFGLNIFDNTELINQASLNGRIDVLDWWKGSELTFQYDNLSMDLASENDHINVLDWWKNSAFELKYSHYAMDLASKHNRVDVLDWWKNSGLILCYSTYAMDLASMCGRVDVLNWWKNNSNEFTELKYSFYAMEWASHSGHINVLDWWKSSGLKLKYSSAEMMPYYNDINVAMWWKNNKLKYCHYGYFMSDDEIINWWKHQSKYVQKLYNKHNQKIDFFKQ